MTSEEGQARHVVEVRWPWVGRVASSQLAPILLCVLNILLATLALAIIVPASCLRRSSILKHPWPLSVLFMAIPCLALLSGIIGCFAQSYGGALLRLHMAVLVASEVPLMIGFVAILTSMKHEVITHIVDEGHTSEIASALVSWGRAMYFLMTCLQAVLLLFGCLFGCCDLVSYEREVAQKGREMAAIRKEETQGDVHQIVFSSSVPSFQDEKLVGGNENTEGSRLFISENFAQDWIHELDTHPDPVKNQVVARQRKLQWIPTESKRLKSTHDRGLTKIPLVEEKHNFVWPGEVQHFRNRGRPYVVSSPSDNDDEMISLSVWGSPDTSLDRTMLCGNRGPKMISLSPLYSLDDVKK